MEGSTYKMTDLRRHVPTFNTVMFLVTLWTLWCFIQVEPLNDNKGDIPYCHKTYFIQDYHMYGGGGGGVVSNSSKWMSKNDSASANPQRVSSERLVVEVNLLHNDLRRERSRRNSLVDFVDNLIRRYGNDSQVERTWRRYHHKYSVDLGHAETNSVEPTGGGETEGARWQPEVQDGQQWRSGVAEERRASRKRGCAYNKVNRETKKLMTDMKRDISSLKNSYGAIYQTYTQLASSHRRLQRDTHRYVQQGERLRMFHLTEMRRLGWALANETDLWHAGVRYLMGKMSCMEEDKRYTEACLNLDPSPRPTTTFSKGNKHGAVQEAHTTRSTTPLGDHSNDLAKDGVKFKLIREVPIMQTPPPTKLLDKSKHLPQPLNIIDTRVVKTKADFDGAGVNGAGQDGATGGGASGGGTGGGGGEVTVTSPTVGLDYEQLQESFTKAGLEVLRHVMEQFRQARPRDCSEIDLWTQRQEPRQTIYLSGRRKAARVYCDEGWTIIQHNKNSRSLRGEGDAPELINDQHGHANNAPTSWKHYRDGIGTPSTRQSGPEGLFWIGNEYIHELTSQRDYRLRIELGNRGWASYYKHSEYATFSVGPEAEGYRLVVLSGTGTAGDVIGSFSATPLGNAPFATRDRTNGPLQEQLVAAHGVGWWYPTGGFGNGGNGDDVRGAEKGAVNRCFTNLNARQPWFCDQHRGFTKVNVVIMKIRPNEEGRT